VQLPRREPWRDDDEDEEGQDWRDEDPVYQVLQPIYERLKAEGIPEERHPTLESLVSHLIEWADERKMERWIMRFARVEKLSEDENNEAP
jgi:hypothetical protein